MSNDAKPDATKYPRNIPALEMAQAHVDRIAKARAESRAKLEREHPDVLLLADLLRARFGDGVTILRLEAKEKRDGKIDSGSV